MIDFAHLCLSSQPSETAFHVNDVERPASTSTRLAEYIIRRDDSIFLVLLDEAFLRPLGAGNVEGTELPSWAPDWRLDVGIDGHNPGHELNQLIGLKSDSD